MSSAIRTVRVRLMAKGAHGWQMLLPVDRADQRRLSLFTNCLIPDSFKLIKQVLELSGTPSSIVSFVKPRRRFFIDKALTLVVWLIASTSFLLLKYYIYTYDMEAKL